MAYTIVIVDDSETIRGVLKRTIQMTKLPVHEVIVAANGHEALKILDTRWVDILFTDINMPEMNGIELIRKMKADAEYCDIPVAIISTEGSKTRINEMMEMGVNGFIRKPFTPEQIRQVILDTLGAWDE